MGQTRVLFNDYGMDCVLFLAFHFPVFVDKLHKRVVNCERYRDIKAYSTQSWYCSFVKSIIVLLVGNHVDIIIHDI